MPNLANLAKMANLEGIRGKRFFAAGNEDWLIGCIGLSRDAKGLSSQSTVVESKEWPVSFGDPIRKTQRQLMAERVRQMSLSPKR